MRRTLTCPKCSARKLWALDGARLDPSSSSTPFSFVSWEVWFCSECRYAEWYAKDFRALDEYGVRMLGSTMRSIDAGAEAQPYRGPFQPNDESPGPAHWPGGIKADLLTPQSPVRRKDRITGYVTLGIAAALVVLITILAQSCK